VVGGEGGYRRLEALAVGPALELRVRATGRERSMRAGG